LIHIEHAHAPNKFKSRKNSILSKIFDASIVSFVLKRCSVIIAASYAVQFFLKRTFQLKMVQVIPTFIVPCELDAIRNDPGNFTFANESVTKILFIGRFVESKGYELYLDLAGQNKENAEFHFLIAGGGPGLPQIEAFARKKCSNFTYLGGLPHGEALKAILNCDILVNLSTVEGLSTTLLEAMYFRKRIVASDIAPNVEALHGYPLAVFCKNELNSVHRALKEAVMLKSKVITDFSFPEKYTLERNVGLYKKIFEDCSKEDVSGKK
jgi:glycosyltransferase involved in cell wall biosynthesis